MTAIVVLFAVGVLLLGAEVFVPGAILGIGGVMALVAGCVLAFIDFGMVGGWVAVAVALALVGTMLFLEFAVLPRTRWGRRLFLTAAVTGQSPTEAALPGVVGQVAEALTTLAPSGYVDVGGRRYEAFCESGYAAKGTRLSVVRAETFRLIVTKL